METYTIGSEFVTFSADAQPRSLAGRTVRRWFVAVDGEIAVRYLHSEVEAEERLMGLRINAFLAVPA